MLIAQITDTHIVEKQTHWLSEPLTKTDTRLSKVVSYLLQLKNRPDVVVVTGDASDTGSQASYDHFKELISPLNIPLYIIPGNHDCREEMRKAFSNSSYMPSKGFIQYVIDDYPVRLIGLDTYVPNQDAGQLCEERMTWLTKTLEEKSDKPSLMFMHHPPAKTGTKVFDTINCAVPPDFEDLMSQQKNLLGIITGHYHHFCVTSCGNKLCFIAPSVVPNHYFADPQNDHQVTALELEEPAITLHRWHGQNIMTSHVIYIREQNERIDWNLLKKNQKKSS